MQPQVGGHEYQKLSHVKQIRLRPDTYIGSPAGVTADQIWSAEFVGEGTIRMIYNAVSVSAAIIGISKEAFDNVTDNIERSRIEGIDPGYVEINATESMVSVKNFGKHIPIVMHHAEKIWVPQLIFGELLTSDNYDDTVARYKIGRNGYGIKLANIFSILFAVEIADPVNHVLYKQYWQNGMSFVSEPTLERYDGPGYTKVSFMPDFDYFYETTDPMKRRFLDCMQGYFMSRAMEMSFAAKIPVMFNSIPLDYRDGMMFANTHFDGVDPDRNIFHWVSADNRNEIIAIDTPSSAFLHGFVNGAPVHQGEHMNEALRAICEDVVAEFDRKHSKKVTVVHLKKHVSLIVRVTLDKPAFDSQIKKKLVKPKPKFDIPKASLKALLKWKLIDELKASFNMKDEKKDARTKPIRVESVTNAIQSDSASPAERLKCTLIITEGKTGKTLALSAQKYLPGGRDYNGVFPIRGKLMNTSRHSEDKISKNRELMSIMQILNAKKDIDYYTNRGMCNTLRYGKIALMADADHDGYHIDGLAIKFIFDYLKTLAPFDFVVIIMTPVIEGYRGGERLAFYHQKHMMKWVKENDATGWNFQYYKGLGTWDVDDPTLRKLFAQPVIITMAIDPQTDDILKLAFHKDLANERKKWIAGYDPNSEAILTNPRPITDFFMEEFRDYSKASVIRAIPRLMDGMKPVHRKVVWSAIKKFDNDRMRKQMIKVIQFTGYVMEKCQYHHGDGSLNQAITIMGQVYKTGPNNISYLRKKGNFGQRYERGGDASPARYLFVGLADITRYIIRPEDDDILEILEEDGQKVEPREFFPIIPMCLVNKCEGIATGWSTKIYPHDPRVVLQWVRQWIIEKKNKRDVPIEQLEINLADKPELIPWWREYHGSLVRVKNTPNEVYRNEGLFEVNFHTVHVKELPVEISIQNYENWGNAQADNFLEKPEEAIMRGFTMAGVPPEIDFHVYGMGAPTVEKLNLIRTISMSNMTLLDADETPKKYNYTFEIVCAWCMNRLPIYTKRRNNLIRKCEIKVRLADLKVRFIMDVVEGRLELRNRPEAEIFAYMDAHGYPYNKNRGKKKKQPVQLATEDEERAQDQREIEGKDFLAIPLRSLTIEAARRVQKELQKVLIELEYYRVTLEEDLWLKDLQELEVEINKLYATPMQGKDDGPYKRRN